jgi:hypothetical protein
MRGNFFRRLADHKERANEKQMLKLTSLKRRLGEVHEASFLRPSLEATLSVFNPIFFVKTQSLQQELRKAKVITINVDP